MAQKRTKTKSKARKTARAAVRSVRKTAKDARVSMNRRAGARKAAATRAKGGPPEKRAKARLTAKARRAAGAPRPRRQGQRFGNNTVGAAMKKLDKLAKASPKAARRKEEQVMTRARGNNSLMSRVTRTARKAADAVVGTGASLLESVTP